MSVHIVAAMKGLTYKARKELPWEQLYADDLLLVAGGMVEMKEQGLRWKKGKEPTDQLPCKRGKEP